MATRNRSSTAVIAGVIVVIATLIFAPLITILLVLEPAQKASQCAGAATGPSGAGQNNLTKLFIGAASTGNLGANGYAYLAAINNVETHFDTLQAPGVFSGTNFAGAAGPMQFGVGGAAGDTWDAYKGQIPPNLQGGTQPPSVYNETDSVYAAAAKLKADGAPGDWHAAVFAYNHSDAYVAQVSSLAQSYTGPAGLTKLAADLRAVGAHGPPQAVPVTSAPGSTTGGPATAVAGSSVTVDTQAVDRVIAKLPNSAGVGYAVSDSTGSVIAQRHGGAANYGASITKSLLLVAYLRQHATAALGAQATSQLAAMIQTSSNSAGNWTFHQVGAAGVEQVAHAAGMTGLALDTSDPVYMLGQTRITAQDFARFFAKIDTLVPRSQRAFAMKLLSSISPADQWGILNASLPTITASKAGWKPEGSTWVVNQAAQVKLADGSTIGVAITSRDDASLADGEQIMQDVASALSPTSAATAGAGQCPSAIAGPMTPGSQAKIDPKTGQAEIPAAAPKAVQQMLAAGNRIIAFPYVYGGGHGDATASMGNPPHPTGGGYDCSSSTSYDLDGGGVGGGSLDDDSTQLESVGLPGPGRWVTWWANSGHVFIEIAGIVMNTAWYAPVQPSSPGSGPRWQPASTIPQQIQGDSIGGFIARHPAGL